jgi:selenoprotein W-related protein
LTDEILGEREIERFIGAWKLIPSKGGVFEFTVNGELLFSKKQMGRHAEPGEIRALLLKKLEAIRPVPVPPGSAATT